jgi:hypothetical protein
MVILVVAAFVLIAVVLIYSALVAAATAATERPSANIPCEIPDRVPSEWAQRYRTDNGE